MTGFAVEHGALRRHVPEGEWAAAGAGLDLGLVEPLPVPTDAAVAEADPELVEVAALVAGRGELRVEIATSAGGVGVLAAGGISATAGALVVRRCATEVGVDLLPEVEASVFPTDRLVAEVMRAFPPAPDAWEDRSPVRLPAEHAARWRRLTETDSPERTAALAQLGWASTPDVLDHLVADLRGTAQVTLSRGDRTAQRHWLLTTPGWVAVHVDGSDVVHQPVGRREIRRTLVFDLAGLLAQEAVHG